MDGRTLTGRDATEAIRLAMRLGATGARFDARRVAQGLRSKAGRARIGAALVVAVRPLRLTLAVPRPRRRSARRLALRSALALAAPGRPALAAGRAA